MDSQKKENLLNLALDATPQEREKSVNLSVGYNSTDKMWNLIVKYVNNLDSVRALGAEAYELLNNYAILTVPEGLVDTVAALDEIIFVEKPKRLNFAIVNGRAASCISGVQEGVNGLYGEGCIVAVIDSGIDYANEVFRNKDGSTRIIGLLDQREGAFYTEEQINEALEHNNPAEQQQVVKSVDTSGHGTGVAAIAAGNFAQDKSANLGIATRASILAVRQ